jgi:Domain of unknown function (DUF4440)
MKKFLVRLTAALIAFGFGLFLTGLFRYTPRENCNKRIAAYRRAESRATRVHIPMSGDEQMIRAIYRDYGPAQTRQDRAFFEKVETKDFILFTDGKAITRDENIRWMKAQPLGDVYELRLTYLQVFDDSTAVAHGVTTIRYNDGETSSWSFTDVLVKPFGEWKIQSTTQD